MESTAPGACEIARLPEDLLSAVISRTAPRDASRAAAASWAFRVAADSDAVWACFLPRDLPPLADGELSHAPPSKKALFTRLSADPTGAKCYMLPARALHIAWGDTPKMWRWIYLAKTESRVVTFVVCDRIQSKMLSQNSTYAAYMVFAIADDESYGLNFPAQEASVSIGETKSTRQVCIGGRVTGSDPQGPQPLAAHVQLPKKRADGWMELEIGKFCTEGEDDGEVSISLMEIRGGKLKKGLIVQGIEIRPKN
ncbi:hypothetical protein EJB05_19261, partial [Eragrostis curvula]